jgi:hypothetical protein
MTWQRREKILASAAGGLVAVLAAWFLLFGGDSRVSAKLRDRLRDEVASKQQRLAAAQRDAKRLAEWQRSALPSDRVLARSRYQNWLRGLANQDGFRQLNIESKEVETRRDMFTRMSFSLHGRVALGDLARFLYDFYSAGHLQQIRQMDIKPLEHSRELDVNLTVEALSLPGADRKDQLTKQPGAELRSAKLDDYRGPIAKRNLFAPYTPPASSRSHSVADAKPAGHVDAAQYAFVTGFTEVDGVRQVWIQDRMAGKLWRLGEGESFEVGRLHGTARKIGSTNDVVVEFDGHRRRLRDGENLRGGVELEK